ncbi:MAG TPA: PEP-CTERM sorting domain-containing protein [Verrucomicrobiae bacterium]|jgi:hypothetical protein|nr:PEP-CTERM sorting domain-containing protein [Verrucomicrobiae bacterium]
MKKILVVLSGLLTYGALTVHADVIADWTFQTPGSTNGIPGTGSTRSGLSADIGTGTASAFHTLATSAWSIPSGNGSTNSFSANGWSANDYFQFSVSTLNYTGIGVTYDQTGSSTGPKDFELKYSIDGGTTFLPVTGVSNILVSTWNVTTVMPQFNFQYDLSALTSVENLTTLLFRVVDIDATSIGTSNGGVVQPAGTDRIDNFIVSGTVVPEPTSVGLAALGGFSMLGLSIFKKRK